jgi:hypothetical protein
MNKNIKKLVFFTTPFIGLFGFVLKAHAQVLDVLESFIPSILQSLGLDITPAGTVADTLWNTVLLTLSKVLANSNGFPAGIIQTITTVLAYGQQYSFIIPFKVIFISLGIVFTWDFLVIFTKMVKWIIERVF